MVDYHIHTAHSIDASGTVSGYCSRAIEIGLREVCFTNHCELDPQRDDSFIVFDGRREPFSRNELLRLQEEILAARDRFKRHGLDVKFGIEVGYFTGIEPVLEEILRGAEIDFVIGAIHCLDHICIDSSRECGQYFATHCAEEYLADYFNAVAGLVRSRMFDSVAHLDVFKKYGIDHYGKDIHRIPRDMVEGILQMMRKNGTALELNTAGMRFMNEFYPAESLMKMARDCGLELITIGSDSHRPEDLGKDLTKAIDYLGSFGFDAVCTYTRRTPTKLSIP
ncbi:histidinol-phosphatase [candidate division WOR-3 bacterium]|nr:histidinol-phosphatase [candidate division WOR-3 bacterium]